MKDGLAGLETSLSSTADQVDKVSAIVVPGRHVQRTESRTSK